MATQDKTFKRPRWRFLIRKGANFYTGGTPVLRALGEIFNPDSVSISAGLQQDYIVNINAPISGNPIYKSLFENVNEPLILLCYAWDPYMEQVDVKNGYTYSYTDGNSYTVNNYGERGFYKHVFTCNIQNIEEVFDSGDNIGSMAITATGPLKRMQNLFLDDAVGSGFTESGVSSSGQTLGTNIYNFLDSIPNDVDYDNYLGGTQVAVYKDVNYPNAHTNCETNVTISDLGGMKSLLDFLQELTTNKAEWRLMPYDMPLIQGDLWMPVMARLTYADIVGLDRTQTIEKTSMNYYPGSPYLTYPQSPVPKHTLSPITFDYQTGLRNVESVRKVTSFENQMNRGFHVASGSDPFIVESHDATSEQVWGSHTELIQADIIDAGLRNNLIDAHIDIRKDPRTIYEFTPVRSDQSEPADPTRFTEGRVPLPFRPTYGYDIGDRVLARAVWDYDVQVDATMRIYGIDLQIDSYGQETVKLRLVDEG